MLAGFMASDVENVIGIDALAKTGRWWQLKYVFIFIPIPGKISNLAFSNGLVQPSTRKVDISHLGTPRPPWNPWQKTWKTTINGLINGYLGLFHPYKWPSVPVRSVRSVLGWLQGTSKKLLVMLGSLQEMSAAKALKIGTGIWMDFGWIWGPKIMVKSHDVGDTSQCLADPKKEPEKIELPKFMPATTKEEVEGEGWMAQNKQEGVSIYCWTCSLKCGQINWPWNMCDCIMGVLNEYLQGTAFLLTSFEGPYFGFTPTRRRVFFFS